jgi:DNA-binding PadR family transcriptional regulator
VLLALADRELYGYAIAKRPLPSTAVEVKLGSGTLYGILKRFLKEGLILERRSKDDDTRRRYYRLTPKGRAAAIAEAARLEHLVGWARSVGLLKSLRP